MTIKQFITNIKEIWNAPGVLVTHELHINSLNYQIEQIGADVDDIDIVGIEDTIEDIERDLSDKVEQSDYDNLCEEIDNLKGDVNDCEERVSDLETELQKVQEELTDYRVKNAKLRRCVKMLADIAGVASTVDKILEQENDTNR